MSEPKRVLTAEQTERARIDAQITESSTRTGAPVIERLPIWKPDSNQTIGICGECGTEIRQIPNPFCDHHRCPVNAPPA